METYKLGRMRVFMRLHLSHVVRSGRRHESLENKALAATHHDVGAPVGERHDLFDARDASHVTSRKRQLLDTGRAGDDTELSVPRLTIGEHATVPMLEDVQRKRHAGKEDERQREEGEKSRSHNRNLDVGMGDY